MFGDAQAETQAPQELNGGFGRAGAASEVTETKEAFDDQGKEGEKPGDEETVGMSEPPLKV